MRLALSLILVTVGRLVAQGPDAPPAELRLPPGTWLLTLSADGSRAAVGGTGEVRVLSFPEGTEQTRLQLPGPGAMKAAFTADGQLVTVADKDAAVRFWNLTTGKQAREVPLPDRPVDWLVGFAPGGRSLALKVSGGIVLVDPASGKITADLPKAGTAGGGYAKLAGGGYSPDGQRFAAGSAGLRLGVWEVATGKQLAVTPQPAGKPHPDFRHVRDGEFGYVAFSPDGTKVATGNSALIRQPVRVWDAATGELLCSPARNGSYTTCLAWTPDGAGLVSNNDGRMVAVDITTGGVIRQFSPGDGHTAWYSSNVFGATPDGRAMLFVGKPRTVNPDRSEYAVYSFRLPPPRPPAAPTADLGRDELDRLWADLATDNVARRRQVDAALLAAPAAAVPYLTGKVPPATAADLTRVKNLVADLDADSAEVRTAAQERLAAVAHRYEPALREAVAASPAGEVRNRLTFVLGTLADRPPPADLQTDLRALELLGRIGTPAAVAHVRKVAGGSAGCRLTTAAASTLNGK